jgi:hypothetical protein
MKITSDPGPGVIISEKPAAKPVNRDGEYSLWIPGYVAAGYNTTQIAEEIAARDPKGMRPDLDDIYRRQLKEVAGIKLGSSTALIKAARNQRKASAKADIPSDDYQAAKRNRGKWVNRIRAVGGRTMPDTSTPETEYLVIPIGHTSFAQVLAELSEVSEDAPADSLAPKIDRTGEPNVNERIAWIAAFRKQQEDAIPTEIRTIPRPVGQILVDGEHHVLVFTSDDIAKIVTPDQIKKGEWITKVGAAAATGRRMEEITAEAFRRLYAETPVIRTEPRLDSQGRITLLPRGVMPPGWRDLAPNSDRESAFTEWKKAAEIVSRSPGGIASHIWGAAIDSYYVRYNDRQSHAIDIYGPDTHTGKSTLIRSIGSMIGDPVQTARPFDLASAISATSYAGQIGYGVLPLDESQLFKGDADERARTIFRLCESGVRTRSLPDGSGVTSTRPFGGVTLLTGNLRFVSSEMIDRIYPGLSRRYLPIYIDRDHPVFENDVDATDVKDATRLGYGWLIPLITGSVTNVEYMGWVRELWLTLKTEFPDENPEVLRIFAGHLSGCRAIDRVFGTSLEISARDNVNAQARIVTHQQANVGQEFLSAIRDHIQVNSGKWISTLEYEALHNRDDKEQTYGVDREPVGIIFPDNGGFMILGKPTLVKLCNEFGIADPDAVTASLDRAGLLKITPGEREKKRFVTQKKISNEGKGVFARGYHVLASHVHGSEDGISSDPEPNLPPDTGPVVQAVTDPFKGAESPAAAPDITPVYQRPDWIPENITPGKDGLYKGVVAAFNKVWNAQNDRAKVQIHNHPYPDGANNIPAPLRLIKRGMGTWVHEGAHSYVNPDITPGTEVTVLDRNAAFLAAIGTAILPIADLIPFEGEGDSKLHGIYQVEEWPGMLQSGPHPWGNLKTLLLNRDLWVTRPTLDLGKEMANLGVMEMPRVISSFLGREQRANAKAAVRAEFLYKTFNTARTDALAAGDSDAVGFIKAAYSIGISTMGESVSNNHIWRPDIPPIIRATSFVNNYRIARKLSDAGLTIVAITHNDEIHVAANPETIFGTSVVKRGRALNEIKVKGGYVMGDNSEIAPDSEWSNDRG